MAKLLRSQGLTLEGGVLAKAEGLSDVWNSAALIDVDDPTHFSLTIDVLTSNGGDGVPYIVGIVPKDAKLAGSDIETRTGVFLSLHFRRVFDSAKIGSAVNVDWPINTGPRPGTISKFVFPRKSVQVTFMDTCLYIAHEGGSRVKIVDDIPRGDYRPCISVGNPGTRSRIIMSTAARKRKADATEELRAHAKALWADMHFPDAAVDCGGESIPVHRGVLAAASPFFAAAFKGQMREAHEGRIAIKDAHVHSVKAFLQYLYTKEFPDNTNLEELLTLAHRYEVDSLLTTCASAIADNITRSNVVSCVATLRPLRGNRAIQECWVKLSERIVADPDLFEGLMEG